MLFAQQEGAAFSTELGSGYCEGGPARARWRLNWGMRVGQEGPRGRQCGPQLSEGPWCAVDARQAMEGLSFGKREEKLGWNAQVRGSGAR